MNWLIKIDVGKKTLNTPYLTDVHEFMKGVEFIGDIFQTVAIFGFILPFLFMILPLSIVIAVTSWIGVQIPNFIFVIFFIYMAIEFISIYYKLLFSDEEGYRSYSLYKSILITITLIVGLVILIIIQSLWLTGGSTAFREANIGLIEAMSKANLMTVRFLCIINPLFIIYIWYRFFKNHLNK